MGKTFRRDGSRKSRAGVGFKLAHTFGKHVQIVNARAIINRLPISCSVPLGRLFSSKVPVSRPRASSPSRRDQGLGL